MGVTHNNITGNIRPHLISEYVAEVCAVLSPSFVSGWDREEGLR